jgi:hypothetical protein
MPRNKSELIPEFSPTVTAWMIAWHIWISEPNGPAGRTLSVREDEAWDALSRDEKDQWDELPCDLNAIAKQVYDAQKQE